MKHKSTFKERLSDALLELLLTVIFVTLGIGILLLFDADIAKLDLETSALIGIGAFAVITVLAVIIIRLVGKRKKKWCRRKKKYTQCVDENTNS